MALMIWGVEEANDIKVDEVDNREMQTQLHTTYSWMLPFLRLLLRRLPRLLPVNTKKAKLAMNVEHSTSFLLPGPIQTSISVESFLAQHSVGIIGLAWMDPSIILLLVKSPPHQKIR